MIGNMMGVTDMAEADTSVASVDKQSLYDELVDFVESWAGEMSVIQYGLMCKEVAELLDKHLQK